MAQRPALLEEDRLTEAVKVFGITVKDYILSDR
jgi:hypothetical protein